MTENEQPNAVWLFLLVNLFVRVFDCLFVSVCLSVHVCVCVFYLFTFCFVFLLFVWFICLIVRVLCPFVCPSVFLLTVYLCVCLFVCLFVCLRACPGWAPAAAAARGGHCWWGLPGARERVPGVLLHLAPVHGGGADFRHQRRPHRGHAGRPGLHARRGLGLLPQVRLRTASLLTYDQALFPPGPWGTGEDQLLSSPSRTRRKRMAWSQVTSLLPLPSLLCELLWWGLYNTRLHPPGTLYLHPSPKPSECVLFLFLFESAFWRCFYCQFTNVAASRWVSVIPLLLDLFSAQTLTIGFEDKLIHPPY